MIQQSFFLCFCFLLIQRDATQILSKVSENKPTRTDKTTNALDENYLDEKRYIYTHGGIVNDNTNHGTYKMAECVFIL